MTELPPKRRRRRSSRRRHLEDEPLPVIDPVAVKGWLNALLARWTVPGVCVFLVGAVAAVFTQLINAKFLNMGDDVSVYANPLITGKLAIGGILQAFNPAHMERGFYAPLTTISHIFDASFYGRSPDEWPGGHHLTNVLLHAATAVLLFLALHQMTGTLWRSAFVATLFAIHPMQVESVAWVTERSSVLGGLFLVLAISVYIRLVYRPWSWVRYAIVLSLFFVGLMCSPVVAALPFVLLALDYWPFGRFTKQFFTDRNDHGRNPLFVFSRLLIEKVPFFALSLIAYAMALFARGRAKNPLDNISAASQLKNTVVSCASYIGHVLYPGNLPIFHPVAGTGMHLEVLLAIAFLGIISAGAFFFQKKCPYLIAGWLWYLGLLGPAVLWGGGGLFAGADRYAYLPAIGLYVIVVWGAWDLCALLPRRNWIAGAAMVIVTAIVSAMAETQASWWHDNESLWTHALDLSPDNYVAHNNLGAELSQDGRLKEAIAHYQKAIDLRADYAGAHYNMGNTLVEQTYIEDGIAHFKKALEIRPNYQEAYIRLGFALSRTGDPDDAIIVYQRALEISKDSADAYFYLGIAYAQKGDLENANANYHEALKIQPDYPEVYYNLGVAAALKGDFQEAISYYDHALATRPKYADAFYNRGVAYYKAGKVEEAMNDWRKALEIRPGYGEPHYNLGIALSKKGDFEGAIDHFKKALAIGPNYAEIYNNLGSTYLEMKQFGEAISNFEKAVEAAPAYLTARNNLAWLLATCSNGSFRDGPKAVELIRESSRLAGDKDPVLLRTLAAAYAEAGHYPEAVQTAKLALQRCDPNTDPEMPGQIREELKFYEAGSPYHNPP